MYSINIDILQEKLMQFLEDHFSSEVSKRILEVIMWAELHNKQGQGLLKLLGSEPLQSIKPTGEFEIVDKTQISSIIKANRQPSFYIAQVATDLAIEKATRNGFAAVGANGIHSGTGALGFYAERIAASDLIGIVMARSPAAVAPFNTKTSLFGTNPLAVGFPSLEQPVVFDMATAATTWYELVLAKLKGTNLAENMAIDSLGRPTVDPEEAMDGAILPFDVSHKASGLSMLVEIMGGPFVGASYCDHQATDEDWGFVVLALSPDLLNETMEFKKAVSQLTHRVRQQQLLDCQIARMPGDAGREHAARILETGNIEVEGAVVEILSLPISGEAPLEPEDTKYHQECIGRVQSLIS